MTTSGYCNATLPRTEAYDPHTRCRMFECACDCHTVLAPVAVPAPPAPAAPSTRAPGFYDDIPEPEYHADRLSLSHSGAKTLLKAPALFRHEQQSPVVKSIFDFGSAAHAKVLGVGDPVAVLEFDDRRTKAYKEAVAEARAAGHVPILRKEADVVDQMADKLAEHRLAMELLSDGRPEVSAYAEDPDTGVMLRCRFDWLGTSILVDYKSAASSDPNWFRRKAPEFGYHQQHAWYLDLARAAGHPAEAFCFIVQMKDPPFLVTVVELVERAAQRGRDLNRRAVDLYARCATTGTWPGYIPDDQYASVDIPEWAYTDIRHDDDLDDMEISA